MRWLVSLARRRSKNVNRVFVDELVYRFLLTRGDSLGGRMLGGKLCDLQGPHAAISVDTILSKIAEDMNGFQFIEENPAYLFCLKVRGIAPNKWANSALDRIRTAFSNRNCFPKTFFIGAAIENAMAQEIYQQLEDCTLSNSANLTNEAQVVSLCDWLIKI